jgi:hypothetical protein
MQRRGRTTSSRGGAEEEFQIIAVGFGLSEFRKAKANPREVLRSRRMRICQAKKE